MLFVGRVNIGREKECHALIKMGYLKEILLIILDNARISIVDLWMKKERTIIVVNIIQNGQSYCNKEEKSKEIW